MDGTPRTLFDNRPCRGCRGRVELGSGLCERCGSKHIRPQPGPQTSFLACIATILLFGGAAGGGKTFALLVDWLRHYNTPGANGLIVRNRKTDLMIGGGLWDEAKKVFAGTGAVFRGGQFMDVVWPSGAKLSFRHLDDANVERFKGPGFNWVGIEEADECTLSTIIYLLSRLRSTVGAEPRLRMTCNPNPDHPFAKWVLPYLHLDNTSPRYGTADRSKSGIVLFLARSNDTDEIVFGTTAENCARVANTDVENVKSFAFIPALLSDNKVLSIADPGYRANIIIQGKVKSAQLGDGNWLVREVSTGMLPWTAFQIVDAPLAPIVRWVRAWDPASTDPNEKAKKTDPDFTIGALIGWDYHGRWYLLDLAVTREGTKGVDKLMASTAAQDGPKVQQQLEVEPGNGKVAVAHWTSVLRSGGRCGPVVSVPANKDKPTKAKPMARELILGMNGTQPREIEIEMEEGDPGVWSPRAFIVTGEWCSETYPNPGDHPKTKLALAKRQISQFFKGGSRKDDIPDAMAIAHNAGSKPVLTRPPDIDRHRRMAGML